MHYSNVQLVNQKEDSEAASTATFGLKDRQSSANTGFKPKTRQSPHSSSIKESAISVGTKKQQELSDALLYCNMDFLRQSYPALVLPFTVLLELLHSDIPERRLKARFITELLEIPLSMEMMISLCADGLELNSSSELNKNDDLFLCIGYAKRYGLLTDR